MYIAHTTTYKTYTIKVFFFVWMEGQQVAAASKCRKKEGRQWIWNKKGRKKIILETFSFVSRLFLSLLFFCAVFFSVPVCFVAVHRETHCVFECTSGGAVEGIETERKVPFLYIFFILWKRKFKKRSRKKKLWTERVKPSSR